MIKVILIFGLLICLVFALLQRKKSRTVAVGIAAVSVAGIYFVLVPQHTSMLAEWMGVGRGADLIFYVWMVISVLVTMSLQFKILGLQTDLTDLTRELALRAPVVGGGAAPISADPAVTPSPEGRMARGAAR